MTLKRIITADKNIQLIQDNVDTELTPLQNSPLTGGVMITNKSLTTGANKIAHTLNKVPSFFVVTSLNANTAIWQSSADASFITLNCSTNCTISFWVD